MDAIIISVQPTEKGFEVTLDLHGREVTALVERDKYSTIENPGVEDFKVEMQDHFSFKMWYGDNTYYAKEFDFIPPLPAPSYFPNVPAETFKWNNGMQSRSRYSRLLLYTRNTVVQFDGSDIPGYCVVVGTSYQKNGKWSNTTYEIQLAAGVKASGITQGWDSGRYVDSVVSMKSIQSQLGLDGCAPTAVEFYLQTRLYKTYIRFVEYREKIAALEAIEEQSGAEFMPYEYKQYRLTRRQGDNMLLVEGQVFAGQPIEGLVEVLSSESVGGYGGGTTTYQLMIRSDADIVELPEYDPYGGDDSLESRGYALSDGKWSKPQEAPGSLDFGDAIKSLFQK